MSYLESSNKFVNTFHFLKNGQRFNLLDSYKVDSCKHRLYLQCSVIQNTTKKRGDYQGETHLFYDTLTSSFQSKSLTNTCNAKNENLVYPFYTLCSSRKIFQFNTADIQTIQRKNQIIIIHLHGDVTICHGSLTLKFRPVQRASDHCK